MKKNSISVLLFLLVSFIHAQEENGTGKDYIEFNDRNNVVHGVYLGLNGHYGTLNKKSSYGAGFKIAYVANQQFELGMAVILFQSDQQLIISDTVDNKLTGGYVGAHLEPILFSKRRISLGFPFFMGIGAIGYFTEGSEDFDDEFIDAEFDDVNVIFVVEPGVSALFNISRYLQLEAGIKYRLSNNFDLKTSPIRNINGLSAGLGIKVGVFNMGRNRYKKKIEE